MKIQRRDELNSFILIAAGSFIMSVALNAFLFNNDLVIGVGGISRMIEKWLDIPRNYTYWFISTFILLPGSLLPQDKHKGDFIFRSFAGIIWVSFVFLPLTKSLTAFRLPLPEPADFLFMPVTSSLGAVLLGLGIGIIIKSGGSTCGLDLIAYVLEKEKNICKSNTMRVLDGLILLTGTITFLGKDVLNASMAKNTLLYISSGLILIYLLPKTVEFIDRFDKNLFS